MSDQSEQTRGLARRLGLFDATMLVMGGIIGAGIFVNPAEVARHVYDPTWIVGVWVLGGIVALAASFVYAELAARRPEVGSLLHYRRDIRFVGEFSRLGRLRRLEYLPLLCDGRRGF